MSGLMNEDIEGQLSKECLYWQDKLYLRDWTVGVKLCRHWDMSPNAVGETMMYPERKEAQVKLLHPEDIPGVEEHFLNDEARDYDITLVHELLHLHFQPLGITDESKAEGVAQEVAINQISRALVRLRREAHCKPEPPAEPTYGNYL